VKIVYDKENNMSKGYGFVKYRSPQSASLAINNLNAYPILNKRLKVAYAKPEDAQRTLQQMTGESGPMGAQPHSGANMDPTQMQYMYYMQLQAQQLWLQQMQQMAGAQGGAPAPGQSGAQAMTPQQQQQMMMMVQQQQAAQAAQGGQH
jgi:RNA recognition motif-containing protein